MKNKMIRFVHDRHQLYTVEQNKTSLNVFNDKRYILEDGVLHSFGHYGIDTPSEDLDNTPPLLKLVNYFLIHQLVFLVREI